MTKLNHGRCRFQAAVGYGRVFPAVRFLPMPGHGCCEVDRELGLTQRVARAVGEAHRQVISPVGPVGCDGADGAVVVAPLDPLPVLFIAGWNRDLPCIVSGLDPFDVYLPLHAGSLPLDERLLDVVHDPTRL